MDFANVAEYFDRLDRLIDAATWASATSAAKLLSINDDHSNLPFLHKKRELYASLIHCGMGYQMEECSGYQMGKCSNFPSEGNRI
ncbi:hypothetical protein Y032_0063g3407 [Ancylostoma ceylanicum]|nr:hypothetical protein Y032_0063g3407 [Ancylostoma ceylanicum]